jgi:hypothetical protein
LGTAAGLLASLDLVTAVEITLVACTLVLLAGAMQRRTRLGRWLMLTAATVIVGLLAVYGREFVSDLL